VREDNSTTNLGPNFTVWVTARIAAGGDALQAHFVDATREQAVFGEQTLRLRRAPRAEGGLSPLPPARALPAGPGRPPSPAPAPAALSRHPPPGLPPRPHQPARYAPLARLRPGPFRSLRFLHHPFWEERPADVLDACRGVGFGPGWGEPAAADGHVYRPAAD